MVSVQTINRFVYISVFREVTKSNLLYLIRLLTVYYRWFFYMGKRKK